MDPIIHIGLAFPNRPPTQYPHLQATTLRTMVRGAVLGSGCIALTYTVARIMAGSTEMSRADAVDVEMNYCSAQDLPAPLAEKFGTLWGNSGIMGQSGYKKAVPFF